MIRKIIIGAFSVLMWNGMNAQGEMVRNQNSAELMNVLLSAKSDKTETDVTGSRYLNETFQSARISGVEGVWPIRYDAYKDEIEVKKGEEIFVLKKEKPFSEIVLDKPGEGGYLLVEAPGNMKQYLQPLTMGAEFILLKQQRIIFKKEKEAKSTLDIALPPRFISAKPDYFIRNNETGIVTELNTGAKKLQSAYPELKQEIKSCLARQSLDLDRESSIKQFTKCVFK